MIITVDVEKMENSLYDVYIETEGSSGLQYRNVTAERIGEVVSSEIKDYNENGYI